MGKYFLLKGKNDKQAVLRAAGSLHGIKAPRMNNVNAMYGKMGNMFGGKVNRKHLGI